MTDVTAADIDEIAWEPGEYTIERSRLRKLMAGMGVPRLAELYAFAANDPEAYWQEVLADLDLDWHQPYDRVWDLSRGKAWPTAEPEPEAWTIDYLDKMPHRQGAAGIYADASAEVFVDNVKVTQNQ